MNVVQLQRTNVRKRLERFRWVDLTASVQEAAIAELIQTLDRARANRGFKYD